MLIEIENNCTVQWHSHTHTHTHTYSERIKEWQRFIISCTIRQEQKKKKNYNIKHWKSDSQNWKQRKREYFAREKLCPPKEERNDKNVQSVKVNTTHETFRIYVLHSIIFRCIEKWNSHDWTINMQRIRYVHCALCNVCMAVLLWSNKGGISKAHMWADNEGIFSYIVYALIMIHQMALSLSLHWIILYNLFVFFFL